MVFTKPPITVLIAIGAVGIAFLFQVIGVAGTGWLVKDSLQIGLWKRCIVESATSKCIEVRDVPHWQETVRAFGLMGVLVMGHSLFCGLLLCFTNNHQKYITLGAIGGALVGAIFSLIEWAVYVGETDTSIREYLGYSFGLTVTATILCFISAIFFFIGRFKSAT